jgi:hypothetical protein
MMSQRTTIRPRSSRSSGPARQRADAAPASETSRRIAAPHTGPESAPAQQARIQLLINGTVRSRMARISAALPRLSEWPPNIENGTVRITPPEEGFPSGRMARDWITLGEVARPGN